MVAHKICSAIRKCRKHIWVHKAAQAGFRRPDPLPHSSTTSGRLKLKRNQAMPARYANLLISALAILPALSACQKNEPATSRAGAVIYLADAGPLSGHAAALGRDSNHGAQLAVDHMPTHIRGLNCLHFETHCLHKLGITVLQLQYSCSATF